MWTLSTKKKVLRKQMHNKHDLTSSRDVSLSCQRSTSVLHTQILNLVLHHNTFDLLSSWRCIGKWHDEQLIWHLGLTCMTCCKERNQDRQCCWKTSLELSFTNMDSRHRPSNLNHRHGYVDQNQHSHEVVLHCRLAARVIVCSSVHDIKTSKIIWGIHHRTFYNSHFCYVL